MIQCLKKSCFESCRGRTSKLLNSCQKAIRNSSIQLGTLQYNTITTYFGGVFNKRIIPLALVGYEMIIANAALRASLAIYQLILVLKVSTDYVQILNLNPCRKQFIAF